mgnify:CR=1 FL=1
MWEAIRANRWRSALLIAVLAGLLVALGYVMAAAIHPAAGPAGVVLALLIWLILFLTAVVGGKQVLLGSVHACQIQHDDHPILFNVVEEMTIASGLPRMPLVYIMDCDAPNAFAVGSEKHSAVAVTTGLLMRLSRDELQGVVAHEIGHIKNHDTQFMTVAGVMVAAIVLMSDAFVRGVFRSSRAVRRSSRKGGGGHVLIIVVALVLAILAPLLAQLLYFACSRRREYLADASSASFTRYPEGLASALEKISAAASHMDHVNRAVAPMFTVNPLKGSTAHSLFSTHPPTKDRVRVLRSMAGGADFAAYEKAYAGVSGQPLIGQRTLAESRPVGIRPPSAEPEEADLVKAREAVDILHRLDGMLFLTCACGLKMKVPPTFEMSEVRCPRCSRTLPITTAALATAVSEGAPDLLEEADRQPAPPPAVIEHRAGQWTSFRCSCGRTMQLSPNFRLAQVRCPACRRFTSVRRV